MDYPFWDTGFGYGVLMASISIVHVFISHFAIGGGLYLVLTEHAARRRDDQRLLEYLERLARFFVLVTLVGGALTGVAIWFTIGLLSPAGTELLIHNFVWGWAIEWTFFVVEITAAILYYYGFRRMSAGRHLAVGWIYFVAAWLSLVIINGILAFMLTPGRWLASGDFWDAFFNPTYFPSLLFRTGVCLLLAGLYASVIASRYPAGDFRVGLVRRNAVWSLIGLAVMAPSFYWFWRSIPGDIIATARQAMPTPMAWVADSYLFAAVVAGLVVLFGLLIPRRQGLVVSVLAMAFAFAYFGSFEFFRESLRKPYMVHGYMYGNGIEVDRVATLQQTGLLPALRFTTGDAGSDLFNRACRSCHTLHGYKALAPRFAGADEPFIAAMVRGIGAMRGNMPPFPGTPEEAGLIAGRIYRQTDHRHIEEITGRAGADLGREVYALRCGSCHVPGGYNDKTASWEGFEKADFNDLLDMAGDLGDEMPAFTGDAVEREALVQYLMTPRSDQGGSDESAGL